MPPRYKSQCYLPVVRPWLLYALTAAASVEPRVGFLESSLGCRSSQIISSERIVSLGAGNSERARNGRSKTAY